MTKHYVIKRDVPRRFLVNYKADLNTEQYNVVTAGGGPILVIAGAGSGKTRTVTYRVARLIEMGVPASRILLVTFTNKAGREMLHCAATPSLSTISRTSPSWTPKTPKGSSNPLSKMPALIRKRAAFPSQKSSQ